MPNWYETMKIVNALILISLDVRLVIGLINSLLMIQLMAQLMI
jgi:hypothetical protein